MSGGLREWTPWALALLTVALLLGLPLLLWAITRDDQAVYLSAELCDRVVNGTAITPELAAYEAYLDRYHPDGDGPRYDVWMTAAYELCADLP